MHEDIFEESWVYQELMSKGMEKQRAQEVQRQHRALHVILQRHFPDLLAPQHKEIDSITDPEVLSDLVIKLSLAQTPQEAQQAIDTILATHD